MKPSVKLLVVVLLTASFFIYHTPEARARTQTVNFLQISTGKMDWDYYKTPKKKTPFFVTFCRTPFAIVMAFLTLMFLILTLVLEFGANIFTGFKYQYPVSNEIRGIGWDGVVSDWWWNPAQTAHLWIAIFLWLVIAGAMQRRQ